MAPGRRNPSTAQAARARGETLSEEKRKGLLQTIFSSWHVYARAEVVNRRPEPARAGMAASAGPPEASRGEAIADHMGRLLEEKFTRRRARQVLALWRTTVRGSLIFNAPDPHRADQASPPEASAPSGLRSPPGATHRDEESSREQRGVINEMAHRSDMTAVQVAEGLFRRRQRALVVEVFNEWKGEHIKGTAARQAEKERAEHEREKRDLQSASTRRNQEAALGVARTMSQSKEVELLLVIFASWRADTLKMVSLREQQEIRRKHLHQLVDIDSKTRVRNTFTSNILAERMFRDHQQGTLNDAFVRWRATSLEDKRLRTIDEENKKFYREMRDFQNIVERRTNEATVRIALVWAGKERKLWMQRVLGNWYAATIAASHQKKLKDTMYQNKLEWIQYRKDASKKGDQKGLLVLRLRERVDLGRYFGEWQRVVVDSTHAAVTSAQLKFMERKFEDDTANLVALQAQRSEELQRQTMAKKGDHEKILTLQIAFLAWYFSWYITAGETRRWEEQLEHEDDVANLVKIHSANVKSMGQAHVQRFLRWIAQRDVLRCFTAWVQWRQLRRVEASAELLDTAHRNRMEAYQFAVKRKSTALLKQVGDIVTLRWNMSVLNWCRSFWRETTRRAALARRIRGMEEEHSMAIRDQREKLTRQASLMAASLHANIDKLSIQLYMMAIMRLWKEQVNFTKAQRLKNRELEKQRQGALSAALKKDQQEQRLRDSMARSAGNLLGRKLMQWKFAMCFRAWREWRWRERYQVSTNKLQESITQLNYKHEQQITKALDEQYHSQLMVAEYARRSRDAGDGTSLKLAVLYRWRQVLYVHRKVVARTRREAEGDSKQAGLEMGLALVDSMMGSAKEQYIQKILFWWRLHTVDRKIHAREVETMEKSRLQVKERRNELRDRWIARTTPFMDQLQQWGESMQVATVFFEWYKASNISFNVNKMEAWKLETTIRYEELLSQENRARVAAIETASKTMKTTLDEGVLKKAISTWRNAVTISLMEADFRERTRNLHSTTENAIKNQKESSRRHLNAVAIPFANNMVHRDQLTLLRMYFLVWAVEGFEMWKSKRYERVTNELSRDLETTQEALTELERKHLASGDHFITHVSAVLHSRNQKSQLRTWFGAWEVAKIRSHFELEVQSVRDQCRKDTLQEARKFQDGVQRVRTLWRTKCQDWEERTRRARIDSCMERVFRGWKTEVVKGEMRDIMKETEELLVEYRQGILNKEHQKGKLKAPKPNPVKELRDRFVLGKNDSAEPLQYRTSVFVETLARARERRLIAGMGAFMRNVPSISRNHPWWRTKDFDENTQIRPGEAGHIALLMTPPPLPATAQSPMPDGLTALRFGDLSETGPRPASPGVTETLDVLERTRRDLASTQPESRPAGTATLQPVAKDFSKVELTPVSQAELQAQLAEMQQHMAAVRARVAASLRQGQG